MGIVEVDETFIGGKAYNKHGKRGGGRVVHNRRFFVKDNLPPGYHFPGCRKALGFCSFQGEPGGNW